MMVDGKSRIGAWPKKKERIGSSLSLGRYAKKEMCIGQKLLIFNAF
jgi:hypothetical protein